MRLTQVLTTLFFISSLLSISPANSAVELLDKIIVEIDNKIITESQLQKRITEIRKQIVSQKKSAPSRSQLRNKVLDRMVLDILQVNRAKQYGIKLSKAGLNKRVETIAKKYKISVAQLRQSLLDEGVDFKVFRSQVETDTIITQAKKKLVYDKIKISDREIDQFLINQKKRGTKETRFRLSHILINVPEEADSQALKNARKKANEVLKRLNRGDEFDKLAIEYSGGQNALEGGDLGWRKASELPALFVAAIKNLKKGEVSNIVQSPSGFHLLKLNATQNQKQILVQETLARHILIKVDAITDDKTARKQLQKLRKQIKDGADFTKLAKQYSQDTGSKGTGGSLGWSVPGTMVAEFETVMDKMGKNQISQPFKSPFGWHLLEVLDRRQSDKTEIVVRNKAYKA
ncbi:MAG: peptidylprolyl isomerase, partial [Gammaproteobacteria bacterium]|nr:peptidylprolyl isomerase [Gammaproteobacteria bacterium]